MSFGGFLDGSMGECRILALAKYASHLLGDLVLMKVKTKDGAEVNNFVKLFHYVYNFGYIS